MNVAEYQMDGIYFKSAQDVVTLSHQNMASVCAWVTCELAQFPNSFVSCLG